MICPECRSDLDAGQADLVCTNCRKSYPVHAGVVRFNAEDDFYEAAYQGRVNLVPDGSLRSLFGLYVVKTHHLWWVRRWVPEGSRLLDLGSSCGARFVGRHTRAVGLDLSYSSLRHLDPEYRLAVQADAMKLPFRDESFDAVSSVYFWEHIAPADKPRLMQELRRILRPGGRMVFLFDVESDNPLIRWYKKSPELYRRCFIDHDHHYGLEPPAANLQRFRSAGFRILDTHFANKTPIQHTSVYEWTGEYPHPVAAAMAKAARRVSRSGPLNRGYAVGLTLFDDLVEPLFPNSWARLMLVALERTG